MSRIKLLPAAAGMAVLLFAANLRWHHWLSAFASGLLVVGASLNSLVVVKNGWRMPVFGCKATNTVRHFTGDQNTKLYFLADRFDIGFGYASIGDFLAWTAMLLTFLDMILRIGWK